MNLYHATSREAAQAIYEGGFRDAEGTYMTTEWWSGVWLADRPLDANDMGRQGELVLVVEAPETAVAEFEWIEDGKTYREFLVPAAIVNEHPIVGSGEFWDVWEDWYEREGQEGWVAEAGSDGAH